MDVNIDEWYAANIENWIGDVEDWTFPTRFVPVTPDLAEVLMEMFEKGGESLDDNHKMNLLSTLIDQIDQKIQELDASDGLFVKLSCRSPKDVTVDSEKMRQIYQETIGNIEIPSDNDVVIALYSSHIKALKVNCGREAIDMFVKSERIFSDLQLALQNRDSFSLNVIIRKWLPIELRHEFRGFVFNKNLNALSQYFDFCFFPQLVDEMEEIVANVTNTFNLLKDKIKLENYICDFGIVNGRVYIIELNPWLETTDSCLFSWFRDRNTLMNGPFECRFNTKLRGGIRGSVIEPWKKYFDKKKSS